MTMGLSTIGLDADDTLWHNEHFFALTQAHFAELLAEHTDKQTLMTRLVAAERRNLPHYGYGIKGFTLSMIETAIEVTQGRVPASVINEILAAGRDMLSHPVEILPGVLGALDALKDKYRLILITKGDLLDQQRKVADSGLHTYFDAIEIVSDKTPAAYARIFTQHGDGPTHGLMAGNSMKSDVLPMIAAGGWGVFLPHGITWEIEHAEAPTNTDRFVELAQIDALPRFVAELA